jgi:hypothetical protein
MAQAFRESGAPTPLGTGLVVGEHQVQLTGSRGGIAPDIGADGRLSTYRTIYHPSETTVSRSTPIRVTSGEDREGVDIRLALEPAVKVSGVVNGPDGPAANLGVKLIPADAEVFSSESGFETAITVTDADGRFTLLGVSPGDYGVKVIRVPRAPLASSMTTVIQSGSTTIMTGSSVGLAAAPPAEPTFWAEQDLSVGTNDVENLSLTLAAGARVMGRMEFEGSAERPTAADMERLGVSLARVDGQRVALGLSTARASSEGTFTTMGYPPGRYFISANAPPRGGWSLKSVEVGGRNVLNAPFDLGTEDVSGVVVRFSDATTEVTGTVRIPPGGDPDALVIVFPADHRAWLANGMSPRLTRQVRIDNGGAFTIRGLSAGEYMVVAVPAGTEVELDDPQSVAALARSASTLSLTEGGRSSLTLILAGVR